jgi:hypothetical protein
VADPAVRTAAGTAGRDATIATVTEALRFWLLIEAIGLGGAGLAGVVLGRLPGGGLGLGKVLGLLLVTWLVWMGGSSTLVPYGILTAALWVALVCAAGLLVAVRRGGLLAAGRVGLGRAGDGPGARGGLLGLHVGQRAAVEQQSAVADHADHRRLAGAERPRELLFDRAREARQLGEWQRAAADSGDGFLDLAADRGGQPLGSRLNRLGRLVQHP